MTGLRAYKGKRDFSKTGEPQGGAGSERSQGAAGADSFCVQKHAASRLHYDLRLELDGVLKSWAVPKGPSFDPRVRRLAVHVEDHPLEYRDFEGVIPKKEYGGGTVMLWDVGRWTPVGDARRGYRDGELKFHLHGRRLVGGWVLIRTRPDPGREDKHQWLLIKEGDEWARPGAPDEWNDDDHSVTTKRTMGEIAAGRAPLRAASPPATVALSLAMQVDQPPEGDEWVHEIKYDGYRILARVANGSVHLFTRNGLDWTERYPTVAEALAEMPLDSAWLDGEIVAFDSRGISDFGALQHLFSDGRQTELTYMVFDLLFHDGEDLRSLPLVERKKRLARLLTKRGATVRFSEHLAGDGLTFFAEACRHHLEGVVSKRAESPYAGRRTRSWLKCRCGHRQELVIGGYTEPKGSRPGLGALLVGVHEADGGLRYAGRVGSGFSDAALRRLQARLHAAERRSAPFRDPPSGTEVRGVHWVTPRLVAEVEFTDWTTGGLLRQAVFRGLREDKPAVAVKRERGSPPRRATGVSVSGVSISHAERLVFPDVGLCKLDIARYYEAVAEYMIPHLAGRPLTVIRCPQGAAGQCFFQKHPGASLPRRVARVQVEAGDGDSEYPVVDNVEALIAMVQLGAIEFHVWGAQAAAPGSPDQIVFDLDPDSGVEWRRVRAAARELREELQRRGLVSFLKTSGGKGLHVVVPMRRESWPEVTAFARSVAESMVTREPQKYTATMSKAKRSGKVFIDHFRNARGVTAVAPYSLRARAGAPVALPISWTQLSKTSSGAQWAAQRVARLTSERADPWRDFDDVRRKQRLPDSEPA